MIKAVTIGSLLTATLFISQAHAQSIPTDPVDAGCWSLWLYPCNLGHWRWRHTVLAWSEPAKPSAELLTANNVTPYLLSQTDLSKGPVVVEIPAATDKASLYGQIVDHWQLTIADVGPSGIDKGKSDKILLTSPSYAKQIPSGYIEVKSLSYRVSFAFRSIKSMTA